LKIDRIEVENFRSLKGINIKFDDLSAIIGRNGAGKSSILYALDAFYNVSAQFNEYDYFDRDTSKEIKITVTYSELRENEKQEFDAYLSGDKLTVTKIINSGGSKYFGASKEIPEFHEIRKLAAITKRQALTELADSKKYPGLTGKVSSSAVADELMQKYEDEHPELLKDFQREQQFFGPKNVGGGKLDKFTKFVLIPAVRDAAGEIERKGAILQLIDVLVTRSVNARSDVRDLNIEIEKRVKEVYCVENLTELAALGSMISLLLKQYAPGAELELSFGEIVPPKIMLPPAIASLVEDNFKCPVSHTGHGLQRALIFALLHQLSIIDAKTGTEHPEDEEGSSLKMPDLILAIEEPELYLHPSRSRYLSQVMLDLSCGKVTGAGPTTQIIYCTHSPYFIDMARFDKVRLASKISVDGSNAKECTISSFTKTAAAAMLATISGKDPKDFDEKSFTAHASPVMTTIVNEGFFADVVVVVEGLSEVGALWALQKKLGKSWDALGVVIVPAGGKNNIDRPVVVFRGFKIPTFFIFDGDSRQKEKQQTKNKNHMYLRLACAAEEDFPETQVHKDWAVFNDELETELTSIGEKNFLRIRDVIASELGYDKPASVLKNPDASARFIEIAYSEGFRYQVLEDIVDKITGLRCQ